MERQLVDSSRAPILICGGGPAIQKLLQEAHDAPSEALLWRSDSNWLRESWVDDGMCRAVVMSQSQAAHHLAVSESPWTSDQTPLLVLMDQGASDDERTNFLRAGVAGFLESPCSLAQLREAVARTRAGELWASRRLLSVAVQELFVETRQPRLTPREHEILDRLLAGESNRDIAEHLFITRETVRWHLRCLYSKLGVHDRASIMAMKHRMALGRITLSAAAGL